MSIRVFNADDHPMLRKGITDLIVETAGMDWVGSAENGKDALEKIRVLQPDVAVLDIEMPYMTGIDVAKQLLSEGCKTEFMIMTLFKDETFLKNALSVGIKGYLLKESNSKDIIDCIHNVNAGRAFVNSNLTHLLFKQQNEKHSILDNLSAHEINILKLIAKQKTSVEIADMMFISPKTVSNHRNNISKKLELKGTQNGLLKWAIEHKDLLFDL
ncbi:MAG: DNA-binding NarL/FixJ family response regulator [Saprospiraceae bacterium]|jgi:DNA-binding NarL/FixJ family response regulator